MLQVQCAGVHHLFHQYTYNIRAKSWAHYVSTDPMHWQERPTALFRDELGSMHSGSAAVDVMNTSGWQKGEIPPFIAAFTGSCGMGGTDTRLFTGPYGMRTRAWSNSWWAMGRNLTWKTATAGHRSTRPFGKAAVIPFTMPIMIVIQGAYING